MHSRVLNTYECARVCGLKIKIMQLKFSLTLCKIKLFSMPLESAIKEISFTLCEMRFRFSYLNYGLSYISNISSWAKVWSYIQHGVSNVCVLTIILQDYGTLL